MHLIDYLGCLNDINCTIAVSNNKTQKQYKGTCPKSIFI